MRHLPSSLAAWIVTLAALALAQRAPAEIVDGVAATAPIEFGGIMTYIGLDVNNLRRWFLGQIGVSGPGTMNVTGYVVYFSDRRNNRNAANQETAEFGFEDIVIKLSTRPEKRVGSDEAWDRAEAALSRVLETLKGRGVKTAVFQQVTGRRDDVRTRGPGAGRAHRGARPMRPRWVSPNDVGYLRP